jgi:hypothetical protein
MNSTEKVEALALALFDERLVPEAKARRARGEKDYFLLAPDSQAASYFERPAVVSMQPDDFAFPGGGGADGLIDALAKFWTDEGEGGLAAMAPALKEIAAALREEAAQSDGSVDVFCYTMF